MGISLPTAVQLKTGKSEAPIDVNLLPSAPSARPRLLEAAKGAMRNANFGGGKGNASFGGGKAAMPALPQMQSYGKAGFASTPHGKPTHGSGPYSIRGAMQSSKGSNRFSGNQFRPSKLCQFWMRDPASCTKGDACTFAHGEEELQGQTPPQVTADSFPAWASLAESAPSRFAAGFVPTMLCKFWMQDPSLCSKGDACSFAHCEAELKANPNAAVNESRSMGPPSRFRPGFAPVKLCQFWENDPASCMKGNACTFAHGMEELNPQSHMRELHSSVSNAGGGYFLH
jgi:hypothetical protein